MSNQNPQDSILEDFQNESKNLINEMIQILETCENQIGRAQQLREYAQRADRMMGTAKILVLDSQNPKLAKFSDFASLCKAVGYKTSQLRAEKDLYVICVALLFDATEFLVQINQSLLSDVRLDQEISSTFLDRLKWISGRFKAEISDSIGITNPEKKEDKLSQDDIDQLIAKLGLD